MDAPRSRRLFPPFPVSFEADRVLRSSNNALKIIETKNVGVILVSKKVNEKGEIYFVWLACSSRMKNNTLRTKLPIVCSV